jgi:ribosomal protein S4
MDNLAVFLGLAPNRLMAQELVNFGGLRVNGIVVTKKNYSMNLNDMLQIDSKISSEIQALYKTAH